MTRTRPLWLLDVDGVLNANKPGWGAARPNRGLQPEHLDAIEAFARQYAPEGVTS